MARILGLLPSALVAARGGMTNRAYYQSLRQLGIAPRQSEVGRLMRVARDIVTRSPEEPFRPLNRVPSGNDLGVWPSKNATGVAQTVSLAYRDKTTGQVHQTWWRTVTPQGITREQAIATAIAAYDEHSERYGQELIGAVHTSAYTLVPGLAGLWDVKHTGYLATSKRECPPAWWRLILNRASPIPKD